ncbi:mitogen-activated protein kinase kinase kinase 3-like [Paramacrobiotus metropolitanus]|uniref:mitogen-activated protein kinase kinase kinase 3-like n=1 Tax=Paramacrobiotus metropolitanus TaxID=2943436 RepID=UPI00244653D9|nr:mitogen-activated protein kinase kinase kinase 3-like [Paramacrobiotus metropolitanus]
MTHKTNGRRYEDLLYFTYAIVVLKHGAELFELLEGPVVDYLTQVRKDVTQPSEDEFLAVLSATWNNFKTGLSLIKLTTLYMDKVFVGLNDLDSTENLGIRIFRDTIVYHEGVRERVRLGMLDNQRRVAVDTVALRSVYEMLIDLGKGTVDVYQEICEHPFLAHYAHLLGKVKHYLMQSQITDILQSPDQVSLTNVQTASQEIVLFGSTCRYSYNNSGYRGAGTFGAVFAATATIGASETRVAVKVMPMHNDADLVNNTEKWNTWCRRLQTVLELVHPHVIKYHAVNVITASCGARIEIVMDYCAGDLSLLLSRHYLAVRKDMLLDNPTAVRYATEIADGLNFLHFNKLIHGDLKPANILVRSSGRKCEMLIGDLDDSVQLRRFMTFSDELSHVRGTVRYMAPEILKKFIAQKASESPGRKSDIWSYGCVILDLANCVAKVEKKRLYKESQIIEAGKEVSDFQFIQLIVEDGFVPYLDGSIPETLHECIRRCLVSVKDARSSAAEILEFLKDAERAVQPSCGQIL